MTLVSSKGLTEYQQYSLLSSRHQVRLKYRGKGTSQRILSLDIMFDRAAYGPILERRTSSAQATEAAKEHNPLSIGCEVA